MNLYRTSKRSPWSRFARLSGSEFTRTTCWRSLSVAAASRQSERRCAGESETLAFPGKLRIIGGRWRGRRLSVPEAEGLRPTPDRVRETLFNWLPPYLAGGGCLDLF